MIAPTQIRKPENWQNFETLCQKLWGEIWNCSDTIQKNGRNGQIQNGVDIYGIVDGETAYSGIQCKCKDDCTNSQLTEEEIDAEIEKAKKFEPPLKRFFFATTAAKDAKIETYIRTKNIENLQLSGFSITIFGWKEIEDLLFENRNTYNWYVDNRQYKDNPNVELCFNNKLKHITIKPQYYVVSESYQKRSDRIQGQNSWLSHNQAFSHASMMPSCTDSLDCRWCEVAMFIENTGSSVIEDYILSLNFTCDEDFELDDDMGAKAHTSTIRHIRSVHNPVEVFVNESEKSVQFRPKSNSLVQKDSQSFCFWIQSNAEEVRLNWELKARGCSKSGDLLITTQFVFEKKYERDKIENRSKAQLIIEPKIVEQ